MIKIISGILSVILATFLPSLRKLIQPILEAVLSGLDLEPDQVPHLIEVISLRLKSLELQMIEAKDDAVLIGKIRDEFEIALTLELAELGLLKDMRKAA